MTENFMPGDSTRQQRLRAMTEVLGKFVANASRGLSIGQLIESTGGSGRGLHKFLLDRLKRSAAAAAPSTSFRRSSATLWPIRGRR